MFGRSLRGYRIGVLGPDALAALTLLVIVIPEQLATARLAGMPPLTGFYAFAAGSLAFAAFGASGRMSIGADSTIAPLFAVSVATLAAGGVGRYVDLVPILAVLVGILLAAVWLLRLGWIAELLSTPIVAGFLAGVAVVIVVHQLPSLLGIPVTAGSTVTRLRGVISDLGDINAATLLIGVASLATVVLCERLDRRLPGALIALVLSTVAVSLFDLTAHGVAVLGPLASGAPHLGIHGFDWHAVGRLAPVAAFVSLVVVTQTAATARAFPDPNGRTDVGIDLLGVGAGNLISGLVGAFPVNASPPRTAAVAEAGGRTQMVGILTALALIAMIPAAGVLRNLPLATLAGVLIFIASRIFRAGELVAIGRFDRVELGLALITLLTVAFLGVEEGIGVAVVLAILDRTRITAQPQLHVLGRLPGTTSWAPLSAVNDATQVPGVLVVLFPTPLWYANATHFRDELTAARARVVDGPARLVVLDALGMTDIDFTGAQALARSLAELEAERTAFAVARAPARVRDELTRSGLVPTPIQDAHFFPTVDQAVQALA